jgi:hypothetical protein
MTRQFAIALIQAPAPTGFVHFDVFEARGSFAGRDNLVRWASTGTNAGSEASNWSWIYNIQSTPSVSLPH